MKVHRGQLLEMSVCVRPGAPGWGRVLLVLIVLALGCATGGGPERLATPTEQADYDEAVAHLPRDPAAARAALEAYLQSHPASPLADDAAWELHGIAEREGKHGEAKRWLELILDDYPAEDRADAARLTLARAALEAGDLAEGRNLVRRVRTARLDDAQRLELLRLQVALSRDPVERLGHLGRLRTELERHAAPVADGEAAARGDVDRELRRVDGEIALILRGMSADQLDRAAGGIKKGVPAAAIRLELAERALDAGDLDTAKRELSSASRQSLRSSDQERLAQLRQMLELRAELAEEGDSLPTFAEVAARPVPEATGAEGTIGVVLPLTGRLGSYGRSALQGILVASEFFEAEPGRHAGEGSLPAVAAGPAAADSGAELSDEARSRLSRGVRIVVRDSGGDPARAAAAVRSLVRDEDVRAIIGPIFSAESEAATRAADATHIPILTLSNREEVARQSPWGFRLRTTAHDEVSFLVDHAWRELGARRFAVLYPKSRYGRGMREEYWNDVLARGGMVTAVSSYDPRATDFADSIRRMVGWELITQDEREMLAERERIMRRARRWEPEDAAALREEIYRLIGPEAEVLPPVVDFDVLFIPDSHKRIEMIAPQLAYHEVRGVRLLGSSDWNHPDLVRIGRHHVSGSVISTPFFVSSSYPFVTEFVGEWGARFGGEPDVFGALGYDATNLVLLQLAGGTGHRRDVRDGLLRVRGYPGVSGVTTMQADGNARRRPYMLGVQKGRIVGLD